MRQSLLLLLLCPLAFGQLTPNSVTVTASRNLTLAPDQIVFEIDVTAPVTSTRDDVIAALDSSAITTANFSGVRTAQIYVASQPQTQLVWSFNLTADLSAMKDTVGMLTSLQQRVAARKNGMSVSFSVVGTQVSTRAVQSLQCVIGDLLADARAQAQKLAGAAGMSVGPILAMASAAPSTAAAVVSPVAVPACTLTVKFALGGF
jgi:uncharacterized protein YggE